MEVVEVVEVVVAVDVEEVEDKKKLIFLKLKRYL